MVQHYQEKSSEPGAPHWCSSLPQQELTCADGPCWPSLAPAVQGAEWFDPSLEHPAFPGGLCAPRRSPSCEQNGISSLTDWPLTVLSVCVGLLLLHLAALSRSWGLLLASVIVLGVYSSSTSLCCLSVCVLSAPIGVNLNVGRVSSGEERCDICCPCNITDVTVVKWPSQGWWLCSRNVVLWVKWKHQRCSSHLYQTVYAPHNIPSKV